MRRLVQYRTTHQAASIGHLAMRNSHDNGKAAGSLQMETAGQAPDSVKPEEATTVYPNNARLLAIGIGLSLAVICSNLVRPASYIPRYDTYHGR